MAAKSAQKREESNARSALIWGSLAFCSILAVCTMIALRIGTGAGELATARIAKTPPPQKVVIQKPAASEFEVARLKDAVRDLAAERDRLTARVATLEQSVGDITASITKKKEEPAPPVAEKAKEPEPKPVEQASAPPPPPPAPPPVVAATPPPVTQPAPAIAARETHEPADKVQEKRAIRSERMPERVERVQERAPERAERTEPLNYFGWFDRPAPQPALRPHAQKPQTHRRTAKATPQALPSPPPIPPARPTSAARNGPATQVANILPSQQAPDVTGATKTEFGIDLGGETSLDGLRARWKALHGHHRDTLNGMQPLVRVREGSRPGTVELHLIAGPFANAGSAARVCAKLQATGIACKAAEFDGQRLSVR
ncbi:MAG TPA: hypothetical protein VHD34_01280 [Xanthobacteraceae bacterium]|nr:hypothetical protein [Xanthobacteraceae bacterium]